MKALRWNFVNMKAMNKGDKNKLAYTNNAVWWTMWIYYIVAPIWHKWTSKSGLGAIFYPDLDFTALMMLL